MTISRIGSVTAATTSLTPTAGLAGDLMVAFAFRSTAATIPTVPSGWTTISSGSGNTCAGVLAYHWCTATNDASGTWTGATQLIITKYRGVFGIGGAGTQSNATGTSISYPALTAVQTAGNSWFVGVAGHRTASNVSAAPTGMTNVSSVGTGPQAAFHDTNGGATGWSAQSVTVNASSGHESMTVELLADGATLNPLDKSASIALSGANLTATGSLASGNASARGTGGKTTGKWFFEVTVNTLANNIGIGLADLTFGLSTYLGSDAHAAGYYNDAYIGNNDPVNGFSQGTGYSTFTTGDKIQCAFDCDTGKIWFGKNDVYVGSPSAGTGGLIAVTFIAFYPIIQALNADVVTVNFGASAWSGAGPPSGFLPYNGAPSGNVYAVSLTEAASASDLPGSIAALPAAVTETGAATDTPSSTTIFPSARIEAATAADTPSSNVVFQSGLTETAAAVDAPSAGAGTYAVTQAETGTAADVPDSSATHPAAVSEAGAAVDTPGSIATHPATVGETAAALDVPGSTGAIPGQIVETGAATDTPSTTGGSGSTISETSAATDSQSTTAVLPSALLEAGAALETVGSTEIRPASVSETALGAEVVGSVATLPGSVIEAVAASDSPASLVIFPSSIAEAGSAADTTNGSTFSIYSVTAAETAIALDATASSAILRPSLSETGAASDSVSSLANFLAAVSEAGSASDAFGSTITFASSVAEAGAAASVEGLLVIYRQAVAETAAAADIILAGSSYSLAVAEAGSALDAYVSLLPVSIPTGPRLGSAGPAPLLFGNVAPAPRFAYVRPEARMGRVPRDGK